MFKVIIADDEIHVVQLIRKLIDWDALGMTVIAEANNGIDALQLIETYRPDIVITDIRMPGYDGIELVKRVGAAGFITSFIIISGYRQFEYAHSALKYGVEDYILKPINKSELTNILGKIADRLNETRERTKTENEIKNRLATTTLKLKHQFIDDIFLNYEKFSKYSSNDIQMVYQFSFLAQNIQFIMVKLNKIDRANETGIEDIVINKTSSFVQSIFTARCSETETFIFDDIIIIMNNFTQGQHEGIKEELRKLHDNIKMMLSEYGAFSISIGLGSIVEEPKDYPRSAQSALAALHYRLIVGPDRMIDFEQYKFKDVPVRDILTQEKRTSLGYLIDSFDFDGLKFAIYDLFNSLAKIDHINASVFFEICEKILDILQDELRFEIAGPQLEAAFKVFKDSINLNELSSRFFQFIRACMESELESKRFRDNKPIRVAKQYVADNYQKQISLDDIAKIVYLNPVYFSVIFKKDTNQNFSDYVINYRIEVAKTLLRDTFLKISEISESVGYRDANYFSKLFSKVVGITPKEFRQLYS